MQNRPEKVPKEVVDWVAKRNLRYPKVHFTIEFREPHSSQVEEFKRDARKYSKMYWLIGSRRGVLSVVFLYLKERWIVRITGGTDKEGNIVERDQVECSLSRQLRNEIAEFPDLKDLEQISDVSFGVPRKDNEVVLEKPDQTIALSPDFVYTSEFSMSGEDLICLLNDPQKGEEAMRAIHGRDWEKLKRLTQK